MSVKDQDFRKQVEILAEALPRQKRLAEIIRTVLEQACERYAPEAIVQARMKTLESAAEKLIRRELSDPVNELTDLSGGRIITTTTADVFRMCSFIRGHFEIYEDESEDVAFRLRDSEFGYRAFHYCVAFKPNVFPTAEIAVDVPEDLLGLKAEIQIRTLLQHAWAIAHDRVYRSPFEVPREWLREDARLAATFEQADDHISAMVKGLDAYQTAYGSYMTPEQMKEKITTLSIILEHDPDNSEVAHRIGRLFMCLGQWQEAVQKLLPFRSTLNAPLLRDLGVSLCKDHRDNPRDKDHRVGQEYLERAISIDSTDTDALASIAGTYKAMDRDKALEYYAKAFELDPTDPYPLGCYIEQHIALEESLSVVSAMRPILRGAIKRCNQQASVRINLPWAFYNRSKFELLLREPYRSIATCAKGVQLNQSNFMIDGLLASVDLLEVVKSGLPEIVWLQRLLLVARAAKAPDCKVDSRLTSLATDGAGKLDGPIVLVAGGCDSSVDAHLKDYRELLVAAFPDFRGTLISGGTTSGISAVVGEIGARFGRSIRTVGFCPTQLPGQVTLDGRYDEIRRTEGEAFTALEPLQIWIDLVGSGVHPRDIKVIGIGGGDIAGCEYRLALALGAKVAIIEGSGGAAAALANDPEWQDVQGLLRMPHDAMTLKRFIDGDDPALPESIRDPLGRKIHANYQQDQINKVAASSEPSLADWDKLPETFKKANLHQADDIERKMQVIGCTVVPLADQRQAVESFAPDEIEQLAEREHVRWNVERLLDGWKLGPVKVVAKKLSPYIVSWSDLPEDVKKWDRDAIVNIPELLASVELKVVHDET